MVLFWGNEGWGAIAFLVRDRPPKKRSPSCKKSRGLRNRVSFLGSTVNFGIHKRNPVSLLGYSAGPGFFSRCHS
ncbi:MULTISPECIES: hypothetical protein [Planktothricoides]|uniref:Uncharacterized protein n=2 Tax=Planktothricoides raciborskii TaxID=132608 RepID=A0AAU8JFA8_9CYAN|nr:MULTISPECIES: hypothetical protein [Planktothricoides]KOR34021.1 hypothetical protein AM228_26470 [Planktothricoides sp. SR001]MBD2547505.1 hypothetical protein [Planktothricoides raciborskii FACHB-1370]MBD2586012.1 hypothetical protein [Planktothricoides raciborskii FACHB-1261]